MTTPSGRWCDEGRKIMGSVILGLVTLCCAAAGYAGITRHLGVVGRTYPVIEPDLIEELRDSAVALERRRAGKESSVSDYQPRDLHPLPRTSADRTFEVDMRFTLHNDLQDGNGNTIYPRGYSFNPLNSIVFSGGLLIIDGNDQEQLAWWEQSSYFGKSNVRVILSGGKAGKLAERYQRPFFYLTEAMATRLRLQAAPSLVTRDDDHLEVREVFIPKGDQR